MAVKCKQVINQKNKDALFTCFREKSLNLITSLYSVEQVCYLLKKDVFSPFMDQCHLYLDLCLSFKRKKVEVSLLVIFQNTIIIWVILHSLGSWCLGVTSTNTGSVLHWVEVECCTHPRRLRRNTHDPRASLRGQLREQLTQDKPSKPSKPPPWSDEMQILYCFTWAVSGQQQNLGASVPY